MSERIQAWRCIGCGRIEAPQPCVGVCQDRKVDLVPAEQSDRLWQRAQAMEDLLQLLAHSTPRERQWETSYRSLQQRARELLS